MSETLKQDGLRQLPAPAMAVYGRRRRRLLSLAAVAVAVVALFAGAAVAYSLLQPRVYGAQADILLTPRPDISDAAVERAMLTQLMIMEGDLVLRPVAERVGMPVGRLREKVSAEIVGRSNILRLTTSDTNRSQAVLLAQLITTEYLARASSEPAAPAARAEQEPPPSRSAVLSAAAPLDDPLRPRPLRALAAGTLIGLVAAAVTVVVLVRPRFLVRPPAFWR